MSDIKIVVGSDVSGATSGLRAVQGELGRTAAVANTSTSVFKQFGSSISSLGSSLISGGILTGITLLGIGLYELAQRANQMTDAQKRLVDVLDGAKGAYVKATLEVSNMRTAFQQARDGVISKEEALKLYNSTIGKTIGQTKDLDYAEAVFTANADKYIKFTLLKAAANIALGKAAEAAFKAEEERIKGPTKEASFLQELAARGTVGGGSDVQRQQDRINKALKEENLNKEIANTLQQQAIALGFDYNAISEKEVRVTEKKIKAIKEERAARVELQPVGPAVNKTKEPAPTIFLQDIILKPTGVKVEISDAQKKAIAEGFFQLLDADRIQQLSDKFDSLVRDTIVASIENAADQIGSALGEFVSSGKFDLPNLFGGIMSSLGAQLQDLGRFLITTSTLIKAAKEAFKKLLANPYAQLVVGIGLVALGAIIKSQAAKKYGGFASGVRGLSQEGFYDVGERGPERIFLPAGSSVQPNNELSAYGGGREIFIPAVTLSGPDLVIAFNRASAAMGRNN